MSPPRRGKDKGGGTPSPEPDVDALRARLAEASTSPRKERPAARTRRRVLPDEVADEVADERRGTEGETAEAWWRAEGAGRPRPVAGGIAARTRKGPIGASWWSRRFLGSLEAVMVGGRMERGRAYARKGQVVDLHVGPGEVAATVQGSREDPYVVRLKMAVVPGEDWTRIVGALAARAGYAARMLAGELPHEVEEVFEAEGASLLPAPHARLVTECTCPDWENPCKHVAAVCYLLAEELDRDPFSLLAWRGRGRDEVLGELRALRREGAGAGASDVGPVVTSTGDGAPGDEPSGGEPSGGEPSGMSVGDPPGAPGGGPPGTAPGGGPPDTAPGGCPPDTAPGDPHDLLDRFWAAGAELAHVQIRPEAAQVPGAVLRLAPRGTISVRGGDLADLLVSAYRAFATSAAARARR